MEKLEEIIGKKNDNFLWNEDNIEWTRKRQTANIGTIKENMLNKMIIRKTLLRTW